jgi:hypothetical protein
VGSLPPNATAYPWRAAAYLAYAACEFVDAASYTVSDAFLNSWWTAVAPFCDGSYVNFLDPALRGPGWGLHYYGPNLPRLESVKQAWAPVGRTPLRFGQEVGAPPAFSLSSVPGLDHRDESSLGGGGGRPARRQ